MKYIFDNNTLGGIFRFYYPDSFPTFWTLFNRAVSDGIVSSVREVYNEILNYSRKDELESWTRLHRDFSSNPTPAELVFITRIYSVKRFLQNIDQKKRLKGGPHADPFIIRQGPCEKCRRGYPGSL
jgi:hypothetical protein